MYQYFRRWCQRGTLQKVLTQFGPELAPGWHFVDSTHVKVHADGSNPAGGQAALAMGRTKGGLNTKIHALVNARSQALVKRRAADFVPAIEVQNLEMGYGCSRATAEVAALPTAAALLPHCIPLSQKAFSQLLTSVTAWLRQACCKLVPRRVILPAKGDISRSG